VSELTYCSILGVRVQSHVWPLVCTRNDMCFLRINSIASNARSSHDLEAKLAISASFEWRESVSKELLLVLEYRLGSGSKCR
jgi:hypothetical protein